MPESLFTLFDRWLLSDESLQFTVSRGPNQTLNVLLQPVLKPNTDRLSDEVESIRAALASPLYLALSPQELDARFEDVVRATATARAALRTSFDALLLTLDEANKAAKAQTSAAGQKRVSAASKTASNAERPTTPSTVSTPSVPNVEEDAEDSDSTSSETVAAPLPVPVAPRGAAAAKELDLFSELEADAT